MRERTALAVALSFMALVASGDARAATLPDARSDNMIHVANVRDAETEDKSRALWSDSAFWGSTMVVFDGNVGTESGFRVFDISTPSNPKLRYNHRRPGATHHMAIWKNLVIVSVERGQQGRACPDPNPKDSVPSPDHCPASITTSTPPVLEEAHEFGGLVVYDIGGSEPRKLVEKEFTFEKDEKEDLTCNGAQDHLGHNFTLLLDLEHKDESGESKPRLLLYVAGTAAACQGKDGKDLSGGFLPVYELPLESPSGLKRAGFVNVGALGGAHDFTVFLPGRLAVVADPLWGFVVWDITDPLNPKEKAYVPVGPTDNTTDLLNVNSNHAAAFSWDGKTLVMAEEAQGGAGAQATDDDLYGRLRFYDISDVKKPVLKSVHKVPASRASYVGPLSVHQINVLPMKPVGGRHRNVLSASWYRGGSSLIDFTDPAAPREIAHYVFQNDVQPDGTVGIHSFTTASFWYNGYVYASNATEDGVVDSFTTGRETIGRSRGLDVFRVIDPLTGEDMVHSTYRLRRMNYSTQEAMQPTGAE